MFRSAYNHDIGVDYGILFEEPTLTQQHFRDECDINNILRRFNQTGLLPQLDSSASFFGDFAEDFDFHESQNLLIEAHERFMQLPSHLRQRFDNDPGLLLAFVSDENNRSEAENLGLVSKKMEMSEQSPLDVTVRTDTNPAAEV